MHRPIVWKIGPGADGKKNTVTIYDRTGRYGAMIYNKSRVRFYWNRYLNKSAASFYVTKGLMHAGVSFMPAHKKGYFLRIAGYKKGVEEHQVFWKKYDGKFAFKKAATWYPIKAKC